MLINFKLTKSTDEHHLQYTEDTQHSTMDGKATRPAILERAAANGRDDRLEKFRQSEMGKRLAECLRAANAQAQAMNMDLDTYVGLAPESCPSSPELVPYDPLTEVPELVLNADSNSSGSNMSGYPTPPPSTPMSEDTPAPAPPAYSAINTSLNSPVAQRPGTPYPFDVAMAPPSAYAPYVTPFQSTYRQSDVPFTFDFRRSQAPSPEQQQLARPIPTYSARHAHGHWQAMLPPRAVMQAKANIPTIVIDKRSKNKIYTKTGRPFFACLPREIYPWARSLHPSVFPKNLLGTPVYNRNGRIGGVTPTGAHTSALANGILKIGIKSRIMFALAVTEGADYRALCEREPLPLPSWTQTTLTDIVPIPAIHRLFHNMGIHPDDIDFALGAVMVLLAWAINTPSQVMSPALRRRCEAALEKARVRYALLKPMPRNYVSYRTALLDRILAGHRAELADATHFHASNYMEIVKAYTPAMHEQRVKTAF
ncbi:hypothetical protein PENSPDRAFT_760520 [Peniophora sp. CONT]|nr:hypothetical protein PENSPDRAFT_760520 [Peniophora sp. CONT]